MKRKVRKLIVIASMISLSMLSGLGGLTAYAQGPGDSTKAVTTTTTNSLGITTYYQDTVRGLGHWEQLSENGAWKFKLNTGGYLTRSWVESLTESGAFYYVNDYGVMSISATTPDGFTVDSTGLYRTTTKVSSGASNSSTADNGNNSGNTSSNSNNKDIFNEEFMKSLKEHELGFGNYGSLN